MRIAILSDIHANIQALTRVFDRCDAEGVDEIVCLGDVVGYGGNPNECCDLLRERCSVVLMGNHDAATVGVMDADYYYESAKKVLYWSRSVLTEENFLWLYSLPYTHQRPELDLGLYHAAPIMPSSFYYVVRNEEAEALTRMKVGLFAHNFIGHSHLTTTYEYNGKKVKDISGHYAYKSGCRYLVNVGSVGQPRDRNPDACFVVFDSDTKDVSHVRVQYDVAGASQKIREVGHDEKFARRLALGV
ncbi:MAG: metallophosphoesterase [Myxococcales bacterium]|nr:metallophosphoesterase [Myxococcales bacterium]